MFSPLTIFSFWLKLFKLQLFDGLLFTRTKSMNFDFNFGASFKYHSIESLSTHTHTNNQVDWMSVLSCAFSSAKATHCRPLPLYGWVIGKRLSLVYNSIVYSIEWNGIECKQFCVLFASKLCAKGGKPLQCDYIFSSLLISSLLLRCVSIYTEAPFIHQSSHFSQFILPLQVNKAEMTTTDKKKRANGVSSKEKLTKGTKTNIKGVVWAINSFCHIPYSFRTNLKTKSLWGCPNKPLYVECKRK